MPLGSLATLRCTYCRTAWARWSRRSYPTVAKAGYSCVGLTACHCRWSSGTGELAGEAERLKNRPARAWLEGQSVNASSHLGVQGTLCAQVHIHCSLTDTTRRMYGVPPHRNTQHRGPRTLLPSPPPCCPISFSNQSQFQASSYARAARFPFSCLSYKSDSRGTKGQQADGREQTPEHRHERHANSLVRPSCCCVVFRSFFDSCSQRRFVIRSAEPVSAVNPPPRTTAAPGGLGSPS